MTNDDSTFLRERGNLSGHAMLLWRLKVQIFNCQLRQKKNKRIEKYSLSEYRVFFTENWHNAA